MLIFLDIETTGVENFDQIVSIALIYEENYIYELLNQGKKISAQASSIHHITNEMIKDMNTFKQSEAYKLLLEHNKIDHTIVTHNVAFNMAFLTKSGLYWKGAVIDTLKVTKHLIPECELFSLQILRYELKLYQQEKIESLKYGIKDAIVAHNALSDTLVIKLLYKTLLELASKDEMYTLSFKHLLLEKLSFGKYKGKYIEEIAMNDKAYLLWLLHNAKDIDEDLKYSINHYLKGQ